MLNIKVHHNSHEHYYRAPFGAVPWGTSVVLRVEIISEIPVESCLLRLWEKNHHERLINMDLKEEIPHGEIENSRDKINSKKDEKSDKKDDKSGKEIRQLFEVKYTLPEEGGLVWYFFRITMENKIYYYGNNKERLGGKGELSLQEPPSFQITVYKPNQVPRWFKDGIIYQIFVDRFYHGKNTKNLTNLTNNTNNIAESVEPVSASVSASVSVSVSAPTSKSSLKSLKTPQTVAENKGLLHFNWYDTPFYIKDEEGRVTRWDFFGGNLAGVREKLDYLQELGISIIYFNPIFEASSNHKYDTADYMKIDAMFGDEEIFRQLAEEAGKRGISLILDGVFSHTGCDSIYFNKLGNYPSIGAFQSIESPYAKWYKLVKDSDKYECWWGVDALPNVNEMEPSYRHFIYEGENSVVRHWLKAGAKGWRLDVADELPDEFIKGLRKAMKEVDEEALLIGEVWEDASNKTSYGKIREYFWGEELDSTMNYPFRNIFLDFMLGRVEASHAHKKIMSLYENYPRENFYAAMNLIGSHDRERVLTLLGEAPEGKKLTEMEKEEFRLNADALELGIKRLKLLSLIQMIFPGVPSVYYGDEVGMEGYADPHNRGTYPWGLENRELLDWHQRMIRLKNEYQVLREGDFSSFYIGKDVYGFVMKSDLEEIVVLMNRHLTEKKEVNLKLDLNVEPISEQGSAAKPAIMSAFQGKSLVLDLLQGKILKQFGKLGKIEKIEIPPLEGRVIYLKKWSDKSLDREKKVQELPQEAFQELPKGWGVLLHITSLPSKWGVGDMGEEAYRFVDFLAESGQNIWQVLPLTPPGMGNSPYQSYSAFAGNDLLLDIGQLIDEGLLDSAQVSEELTLIQKEAKELKDQLKASFDLTGKSKRKLYRQAFLRFQALIQNDKGDINNLADLVSLKNSDKSSHSIKKEDYFDFCRKQGFWLEDYALYMAIKEHFHGAPWYDWEKGIAERREAALTFWREKLKEEIDYQYFLQYTFYLQWQKLKNYANAKGIRIVGDLPIYVSEDSSDTWVHRKLFALDEEGRGAKIAGVPPDYFSENGQLWGNPVYLWEEMAKDGFSWWKERVRHTMKLHDYLRLDHFRGFEGYWAVSQGEKTAINGIWLKGPGKRFFEALHQELGELKFIAEDLGMITPEVDNLKNIFSFPGMKIFQFSHQEPLPDQEKTNIIYYSGTHDNDTLVGWCQMQEAIDSAHVSELDTDADMNANMDVNMNANMNADTYEDMDGDKEADNKTDNNISSYDYQEIIERLYQSSAAWVIVPMQDILGLGSEGRMNTPGTVFGNWEWKLDKSLLTSEIRDWLSKLSCIRKAQPFD